MNFVLGKIGVYHSVNIGLRTGNAQELHFLNHKFTSWLMFFKLRSSYSVMRHIEINCCKYNAWLHHAARHNVRIQWR